MRQTEPEADDWRRCAICFGWFAPHARDGLAECVDCVEEAENEHERCNREV